MMLSPRVIKQVDEKMENWLVYPKINYPQEEPEEYLPIEDLTQEANDILESAHYEAKKLLEDANNRILVMEQEACEQGYKKGEQDACQAQKKEAAEFYSSTSKILQEVEEIRTKIYRDTEEELVKLAVDIAEKLVCRQLELNPETIADIAKAACIQAKECELVIIYAQPDQIDILKARQDEIASQLYRTKRLEIIADPNIKSGGCRIETEQGYIDATIATMLEQLSTVAKEEF